MDKKNVQEDNRPEDLSKFVCGECGSERIRTSREIYNFPYGVGNDTVELSCEVPFRKCSDCGFSFLDHVAEDICQKAICQHLGVMTPSQVKGLRKLYNLTQSEFAEITKLGPATLSRWERGIVIQNQAYDNYLYLLGFKENLRLIQERSKSAGTLEDAVETKQQPTFRELKVTKELLDCKRSFKLTA